jgi:nitrate reductase delta subunit
MSSPQLRSSGAGSLHPGAATLRVLAALLSYPDAHLRGSLPEIAALLAEDNVLAGSRRGEMEALTRWLASGDALDAETAYVETFDRGRATSLHLFEHVHGDSRDRGPAMVDLAQTYAAAGLMLREGELPDYLPAVLEFVSTQPAREAKAFLGEIAHLVNAIFNALLQRGSPYASVLGALLDMAGEKAQAVEPVAEASLDETWVEPAAFEGCSSRGQARPGDPQRVRIVRRAHTGAQGAGS